jgi:hypothetical protein
MTDPYPATATTSVFRTDTAVADSPAAIRDEPRTDRHPPSVQPEKPRQHPIAYAALALSVIALLWLAVLSASSGDNGYQKVRVGTQDCVSVPQDAGPAALYCRTGTTAGK